MWNLGGGVMTDCFRVQTSYSQNWPCCTSDTVEDTNKNVYIITGQLKLKHMRHIWGGRHLHSFSSCCLPVCEIQQSSLKIRTYSSSRSSKVIDIAANRKRTCNFLLVVNSKFGRILAIFEILTHSWKIVTACFPNPTLVWRRKERPATSTLGLISTPLKRKFNGLQFRREYTLRVYLHSLSSCCIIPNLRNLAKFRENSISNL